jgi:coproporphyrinogen III oxidase-like Fe-S oxidoreductase
MRDECRKGGGRDGIGVSLGVQTLDPGLQAAIGRVQPQEQVVRSVERLRARR